MMQLIHSIVFSKNSLGLNIGARWTEWSLFFFALLIPYIKLWSAVGRRAHLHGCPSFWSHSMGLRFTRQTLPMPCVYAMAGLHLTYPLTVSVARPSTYISHALSCPHRAFPIIRHNNVRDLTAKLPSSCQRFVRGFTAKLMSEVCHDVQLEPHLQPLSGELLRYKSSKHEDDARVDIRAAGFWGCCHHRFFDVRVFNTFAESNQSPCLAATFRRHEGDKRQAYEECIWEVEQGNFTPLVFSSSGGMGKAASVTYKCLASLLRNGTLCILWLWDGCIVPWDFPYSAPL